MWRLGPANVDFTYPIAFTGQIAAISTVDAGVPNTSQIKLTSCRSSSYQSGVSSHRHNVIVIGY